MVGFRQDRWALLCAALATLLAFSLPAAAQTVVSPTIAQVYSSGRVTAILPQPDGKIVIAGQFTHIGGVPRGGLARLNADGSLDATWNPGDITGNFETVYALVLDGGGNLYVGGGFTAIGGVPRNNLARISSSGVVDATWNPNVGSIVFALVLDGGNVFIGGSFSSVGGLVGGAIRRNLAKISTSGTGAVDANWVADTSQYVNSVALDGAGSLYAGGNFNFINGQPRSFLAKIATSGTGTLDPTWNPNPNNAIQALALDGSGSLYATGAFTTVGGQNRNYFAKLSTGGTGAADATWDPNANSFGYCLALDGASLYACGDFTSIGGQSRTAIAKLSTSGTGAADPGWNASPDGFAQMNVVAVSSSKVFAGGLFSSMGGLNRAGLAALGKSTAAADPAWPMALIPGAVNAIVRDASGRTVIGGRFVTLGDGSTTRRNIARFNADGTLDAAWIPDADGPVNALVADSSQNIYAGGFFTAIGGQARNRLARLSPSGSGAADATWNPNADSFVQALALDSGAGTLYAGGGFANIGGLARSRIAKLSTGGSGSADGTWNPNADGFVNALALDGAGSLFAGGDFANIGGQTRNRIAKLAIAGAGAADGAFNPNASATVHALAISGSGIYAGGAFTTIGGATRNRIGRVSATTGAADAWDANASFTVRAIVVDLGNVYAGGDFNTIGGQSRSGVARLSSSTGAASATWIANTGVSGSLHAGGNSVGALAFDNGFVYVGGTFMSIAGQVRASYAALAPPTVPGAPVIGAATPDDGQATIAFTPPASNGGSAITSYTVSCVPSGGATGPASPLTVVGLTNGVQYSCSVKATNAIGTGPASASVNVTPTPPAAPVITSVNATTFTVGTAGSFTVTASGSPAPTFSQTGALPTGVTFTPGTATLAGTPPGASVGTYGITFTATNSQGTANQSFTLTVAPNVPGKPVISSIVSGSNQATINFLPPPSNGSPIVSYKARCSDGATTVEQTASAPPIVVTGLTNGVPYTCTVDATNGVGDSPQSDPGGVTPGGGGGGGTPTTNVGSLAFGGQSMGTTSPVQEITITNPPTASAAINITGISLSPQFGQSNNCTTLAIGASCKAQVTFTPAVVAGALNATVPVTGTLTITTSANHNLAVSLSGTAEKSLVTHYYRSILRRAPDSGGHATWSNEAARVAALGANVNETWFALSATFYRSGEYVAQNRNTTEYIRDLYNTFFNRAADDGGLAFWTGQINSGLPREVALTAFMFSGEFASFTQAIFGNPNVRAEINTIVDFYRGLLGRLPDDGGFNFWVGRFRTAQCQGASAVTNEVEAISSAFALSGEYAARGRDNTQYVGDLYNAFLRRGGDLGGFNFWVNQVAGGFRTREQVRIEFKNSPEFQGRVNAIINQGCMQ